MKYFLRNITGKGIKFFESDSYIYIAFRYEKIISSYLCFISMTKLFSKVYI
jgi:hypothetical protein